MAINTLTEKMTYELGGLYDAEHQFLELQEEALPQATSETVQSMLQMHIEQTREQITVLEQVFEAMGAKAKREKCAAAAGLVTEAQTILKKVSGNPALVDLAIGGAQSKVENFEVACYRGLITGAEQMGQTDIAQLLQKNLKQEEQTAKKVEQSTPELFQQALAAEQQSSAASA